MTTTINRRTALMGTVTLPAAMAPLTMAQGAEPDPFIDAFHDFLDAEAAYIRSFRVQVESSDDYVKPFCDASFEAREKMAVTMPTTPAGLRTMIHGLVAMFGEPESDDPENIVNPDAHDIKGPWAEPVCETYMRSLLAAADRMLPET